MAPTGRRREVVWELGGGLAEVWSAAREAAVAAVCDPWSATVLFRLSIGGVGLSRVKNLPHFGVFEPGCRWWLIVR
jgi:hypothetical protein